MTSTFDRQSNCLPEPERELLWTFFTISLDPVVPGMLKSVYDFAWSTLGDFGVLREQVFRAALGLQDVSIIDVDFVVSGNPSWFSAWAASIGELESDPFADCPCDGF